MVSPTAKPFTIVRGEEPRAKQPGKRPAKVWPPQAQALVVKHGWHDGSDATTPRGTKRKVPEASEEWQDMLLFAQLTGCAPPWHKDSKRALWDRLQRAKKALDAVGQ